MARKKTRSINSLARIIDFRCPVCSCIPSSEIYQCKNGHALCAKCYTKLANCPICRASIRIGGRIRNLLIEEVLQHVKFKCGYCYLGCRQKLQREALPKHEKECKYNPCPEEPKPDEPKKAKAKAKRKQGKTSNVRTRVITRQGPPMPQRRSSRSTSAIF